MSEQSLPANQPAEIVAPAPNAGVDKSEAAGVQATQGSQVTMAPGNEPESKRDEGVPVGEVVQEDLEIEDEEDLSGGQD